MVVMQWQRASAVVWLALLGCDAPVRPSSSSPEASRASAALTASLSGTLLAGAAATLDQLGAAVAFSADGAVALVGAPLDDTAAGADTGSVRAFVRTGSTWTESQVLVASDAAADDRLGSAVALSADGTLAVVGVPYDDTPAGVNAGSARVFVRAGAVWSQTATLLAKNGAPNDLFGFAVAISSDGTRIVVGAPYDELAGATNDGSARVFALTGNGWVEEASLVAASPGANDLLGSAVAIDADGTRVVVGAPFDDTGAGADSGSARVYLRTGTSWAEETPLLAVGGAANDQLGTGVSVSGDGRVALVGAPRHASGGLSEAGTAQVFTRDVAGWAAQATLSSAAPAASQWFGSAVSLSADGRRALVGAPYAGPGSARLFLFSGGAWVPDVTLTATAGAANDGFGAAVALSGDGAHALVGAPTDDSPAVDAGSAWVFDFTGQATGTSCTAAGDCATGFCVDGVCCASACGAGGPDCRACSTALTGLPNGTCGLMRASAVCRPSQGSCDPAEVCDGVLAVCPGDVVLPAGVVCRAASDACDAPESCDGAATACPADAMKAAGTVCRGAAGPCDLPDVCDGTTAACADAFRPDTFVCAPAGGDICDAPDHCTGSSADCPPTYLTGVLCRPQVASCDLPEFCSGTSASCPPDAVLSAGIVCRASTQTSCDPAEQCDGVSASCPSDQTTCRPGSSGCSVSGGADAVPGAAFGLWVAVAALARRRRC